MFEVIPDGTIAVCASAATAAPGGDAFEERAMLLHRQATGGRDHGAELGVRQRKRNQGSAVEVLDFTPPLVKHGRASPRNRPSVRWWVRGRYPW